MPSFLEWRSLLCLSAHIMGNVAFEMRTLIRRMLRSVLQFRVVLAGLSCYAWASPAQEPGRDQVLSVNPPRYEIWLNQREFSVLHAAAVTGVENYGSWADFRVRIQNTEGRPQWKVTIDNPKMLEVWGFWMSEKTRELVAGVDFDHLEEVSKLAFRTVQSVNAKIAESQAHPIWNAIVVSGNVVEADGKVIVETAAGKYELTGASPLSLAAMKGKSIVVTGFNKIRGQLEVISFLKRRENTLEIFVMSYCPFAQRALTSIIEHLRALAQGEYKEAEKLPELDVRYIFYKKTEGEESIFSAMHGENEIRENLVQILIRETYPAHFHEYVLRRAGSTRDWKDLAREVGLADTDVQGIEKQIDEMRDALIQTEYEYVAGTHGVLDGSPTYFWESQRIGDIGQLPAFSGVESSSATCAEGQ